MFFTLLLAGLCLGGIYAIVALGYSLIYKASGLMNFAMGDILTLGAFIGWTFAKPLGLPYFVSLGLTMVVMFFFGIALEKGVIRTILNRTSKGVYVLLATIAISYIIRYGSVFLWGAVQLNFPSIIKGFRGFRIGSYRLQIEHVVCIASSLILMLLLHFFMTKTRFGTAMRAAALDPVAAQSCGINVSMTTGVTWAIASMIGAIGGILIGPLYGVYTTLGASIGRKCFASAILGGYGNMYGAMVGGLIIGLLETMIAGYVSSTYKDLAVYVLLLFFLFVKPTGLFNERTLQE